MSLEDDYCIMTSDFNLPERLKHERLYGQLDNQRQKKKHFIEEAELQDVELIMNKTHMPRATIYGNLTDERLEKTPASPNVLSIIGVLPYHLRSIQKFFNDLAITCTFDEETTTGQLGNWTVVTLGRKVENIPEIKPVTQFDKTVFGACYVGRYQEENIYKVPMNNDSNKDYQIFRLRSFDTDQTSVPFEDKSLFVKFREFILGQNEINVDN